MIKFDVGKPDFLLWPLSSGAASAAAGATCGVEAGAAAGAVTGGAAGAAVCSSGARCLAHDDALLFCAGVGREAVVGVSSSSADDTDEVGIVATGTSELEDSAAVAAAGPLLLPGIEAEINVKFSESPPPEAEGEPDTPPDAIPTPNYEYQL